MIKVEDLKIGDVVKYKQKVYTIEAISKGATFFNDLDPIPLTPEILKNNGFKLISDKYYIRLLGAPYKYLSRNLSLEHKSTGWKVYIRYAAVKHSVLLCTIKYVHELQHILWASGEDSSIKI